MAHESCEVMVPPEVNQSFFPVYNMHDFSNMRAVPPCIEFDKCIKVKTNLNVLYRVKYPNIETIEIEYMHAYAPLQIALQFFALQVICATL